VSTSCKQAYVSLQKEDLRVKQVVAAQDRNLVLLEDSQRLIAWGGNEKGQLGLGNYEDRYQPTVIDFFSR
jgi:alpha-tubulin suppressor-like RCC1 family protein